MSYLFKREEIGDYRISIYQDDDPLCPYTDIDLVGKFIYENSGCCRGNLDEYGHDKDIDDVLRLMVLDHIPNKTIIGYTNEHVRDLSFQYDKSRHMWILYRACNLGRTDERWREVLEYTPDDVKNNYLDYVVKELDVGDLEYLMEFCQKEIAFTTWSSRGYSQGDCVEGFAYCDKKRFLNYFPDEKDWRKRAVEAMQQEAEEIGKWLWGDVLLYTLEKKVHYIKTFPGTDREPEDGYEWEMVGSCGSYFIDDADDLIDRVIEENGLVPKKTA